MARNPLTINTSAKCSDQRMFEYLLPNCTLKETFESLSKDIIKYSENDFPNFGAEIASPFQGGRFSNIFEVTLSDKTKYALKLYKTSDECRFNFLNDLHCLKLFRHQHIVSMKGYFQNNSNGILLELLERDNLRDIINDKKLIENKLKTQWCAQIASGLAYIHSISYCHSDIKPENICFTPQFREVKICDFGSAINETDTKTSNCGSSYYRAPELFKGQPFTDKCDVYSFSITMWELFTYKIPYPNLSADELFWAIASGISSLELNDSNIPDIIKNILEVCLSSEAAKRLTAAQLQLHLSNLSSQD
uniref:Protein kinase domain-containing protein n=1 Tax=Rhabditophanes sp. KR3021 TaxID=114890 RepID=A0AC35TH78_9BILA